MSDTTVKPVVEPVVPEPVPTPTPEPTPATPVTTLPEPKTDDPSPPEGFIEQKRFTGAIQKIQTLTEELRVKDQEQAALNSQIEQIKQQQAVREAEVTAGYGERDKQLEAALKDKLSVEAESGLLKNKIRKIDMAKELGHPELVNIIDTIPTFEDDALQKKAMEDIIGFSQNAVQAREDSLLSGLTPAVSPTTPVGDALPASDEAWSKAIEVEEDPTKRKIMFDQWYDWGTSQKKAK